MKLPFVSSQSNSYEPKSVLDIRRSPPCPVTGNSHSFNPNTPSLFSSPLDNFEHGIINQQLEQQQQQWDSNSLMKELGLNDDDDDNLNNCLDLPQLPPFFHSEFETLNPYSSNHCHLFDLTIHHDDVNEIDFRDDLVLLSECCETQSFQLAQLTLARLNQRLSSPTGKAVQRAAFYFKEAIQCLLTGSTRSSESCTSYEIVQVIKAYRTFSTVSPIPLFSSFTANQAILDAVDGAMDVHVIDFDIGLGGQWASFLKAVAEKAEGRKVNSPAVRITAVVPEEYEAESKLIRDNLLQFSNDLKLRFEIDFVSIRAFEYISFKAIKFMNEEKTAVLLTPAIFRRVGSGFVDDLRRVSPNVVVYVDTELNGCGSTLFRQTVIDGMKLYTTILESLEATDISGGMGAGGGDWIQSIEMYVLLPKIIAMVEYAGRNVTSWREALGRAGMKAVGMSQFTEFGAECLVRRVKVRGFHVVKQQAEMVLCWHDRPLVATSVWAF